MCGPISEITNEVEENRLTNPYDLELIFTNFKYRCHVVKHFVSEIAVSYEYTINLINVFQCADIFTLHVLSRLLMPFHGHPSSATSLSYKSPIRIESET